MRFRRVAGWFFFAAAALAVASLVTYSVVLLVAPVRPAEGDYHALRRGDDYIVFTQPVAEKDEIIHGSWRAAPNEAVPDRLWVVHGSEIDAILAGRDPAGHVLEARPGVGAPWGGFDEPWRGRLDVALVERGPDGYVWPWDCDACADPRPTIVWTRGTAWQGAAREELTSGNWRAPNGSDPTPIEFEGVVTEHNFDDWTPVLAIVAGWSIAASIGAGVVWLMARRPQKAPTEKPAGTEELLRLVTMADRYLELMGRQFVVGGAVLAVGLVGVLTFVLPAIVSAAREHFVDPYYPLLLVGMGLPFVLIVAAVAWVSAYRGLVRERARWKDARAGLSKTMARLGEP